MVARGGVVVVMMKIVKGIACWEIIIVIYLSSRPATRESESHEEDPASTDVCCLSKDDNVFDDGCVAWTATLSKSLAKPLLSPIEATWYVCECVCLYVCACVLVCLCVRVRASVREFVFWR